MYSAILARAIGWPTYLTSLVERAAALHDIGKVGVPDAILRKSGQLTDKERQTMATHTELGLKILGGTGTSLLNMAATIAHRHHERYDGKGYPRRLKGEEIPLEARIVTVADVYDALTTPRLYKPRWTEDAALRFLKEGRGSQFDPRIVDALFDHIFDVRAATPGA